MQSHNVTIFSVLSKEALPGDFTEIRFVRVKHKTALKIHEGSIVMHRNTNSLVIDHFMGTSV